MKSKFLKSAASAFVDVGGPMILLIVLSYLCLFTSGCAQSKVKTNAPVQNAGELVVAVPAATPAPEAPAPTPSPEIVPVPGKIYLYWENTTEAHPERIPWSDAITGEVRKSLVTYAKAKDITGFCPKFHQLSEDAQVKAIGEIWVGLSYYESSFKPETTYRECSKLECKYGDGCTYDVKYGFCMKGGHKLDGGRVISRGLTQISLQSAQGYGCDVKVPSDLHDPIKNLVCANKIMVKQINRTGGMASGSNYWATIKGSYSGNHIADITARVKRQAAVCK